MYELENLIKYEYFPSELPPCFNTDKFKVNKMLAWANGCGVKESIPLIYNGFKNANSRRRFALPNICHYCNAMNVVHKNSEELEEIFKKSNISLTKPLPGKPIIRIPYNKITYSIKETRELIEDLYQDNLYEIRLDIMSFFDNIYTHTITWAMHTKKRAKDGNLSSLTGDKLDNVVRLLNHKQTNGILVGNGLSRIVSEILLCTIDIEIQKKFPHAKIKRYVDDYYIYTKNSEQVQVIIAFIRKELGKYELELNQNKLSINNSPFLYGSQWVEEISLFSHLNTEALFNKMIMIYKEYHDIRILRYGMRIISNHNIDWVKMESKIINLWVSFPSLSDIIIHIFLEQKDKISLHILKRSIYTVLDNCVLVDHEQEVIWAVWIAKVFNIKLNAKYINKVIDSDNVLAVIILLDMIDLNICEKSKLVKDKIISLKNMLHNETSVMWSKYWILAYEADLNKWLNDETEKFEAARNEIFFKSLIKDKIRFYESGYEYENVAKKQIVSYITKYEFEKHLEKITEMISRISEYNDYEQEFIDEQIAKVAKENKEFFEDMCDDVY